MQALPLPPLVEANRILAVDARFSKLNPAGSQFTGVWRRLPSTFIRVRTCREVRGARPFPIRDCFRVYVLEEYREDT